MPPADTPAHQLRLLAKRVRHLGQRRVTDETFHAEKSEITRDMLRLADRLRDLEGVQPTTTFHRTPAGADARLRRAANDNAPFFKDC